MADLKDWSLYPYNPVKPLPIIFAVIISLLGLFNIWQNFVKHRWQRFGFIMTWASLVWIGGFVCRAYSQYHVQNIGAYIAQYVMILMGPPLYAASETFILGRLLAFLPYHAPIHPGRVVSTFVIISAVIEALAGNGASRLANLDETASQKHLGFVLIEVALLLQAVLEVAFQALTIYLFVRCYKTNTLTKPIRIMATLLLFTSSQMLVRCIVRVAEAFEAESCGAATALEAGGCGYAVTHEWILWVFEVANITLFVIAWTVFTPGAYLPHSDKVYLDKYDGKTIRLGPGFADVDKRPLIVTVFDPFNLFGILTGKGHKVTPFWEQHNPEYVGQPVPMSKEAQEWAKLMFWRKKRADSMVTEEPRKESV